MVIRPSGTVTFLFSDIEGSTRLWETHPEEMAAALRAHDSVMRSAIQHRNGYIFSTAGDAYAAAFARAGDAVAAGIEAQRALAELDCEPVAIRVRMGIHTGEAEERGGDYFGTALNRGARLMAVAHGGQVLTSLVTARLVADRLPGGVHLVDLGEHRLRDIDHPEHLFQVTDTTLHREFPPLRSLGTVPSNLPRPLTRFIGRRREIDELVALVPTRRIVTLTGVGGVGKTRLALEVGAELLDRYRDGVWFVEFAGITEGTKIAKQVAEAMHIQERADRPISSTLVAHIRRRETLLLLDNCEHLVGGVAAFVEELVQSTAAVSVLATSREVLGVAGETAWTVPPMPAPRTGEARLPDNDAIALFVDRARLVRRDFVLTEQNEGACAEICRRLDGVPLAIELAAARVDVLSPQDIADRLSDSMALLTTGPRTAAARQQTLRAAMDWSYDLLDPDERAFFRRLAVFRGGFTLDAVDAMWSSDESSTAADALDLLEHLIAKSMVTATESDGHRRFGLLETVRYYAWDRLEHEGELDAVLARHRAYFLTWAHSQSRLATTPDQLHALAALEADHDNLRAVLERSFAAGDLKAALLLAADLSFFWFVHSHFGESGAWYDRLMAERTRVDPWARTKLLLGAGEFAENTGDHDTAVARFEEARRLARTSGSLRLEGWALFNLFNAAIFELDLDRARELCRQALERFTAADDQHGVGLVSFTEAALEIVELRATGSVAEEDAEAILARLEPMVAIARTIGERNVLGHALEVQGTAALMANHAGQAAVLLADAVDAFDGLGNQSCLAHCLDRIAWLADETGRPEDAVQLVAATAAMRDAVGIAAPRAYASVRDSVLESAHAKLTASQRDAAWQTGAAMGRDAAVRLAHGVERATNASAI